MPAWPAGTAWPATWWTRSAAARSRRSRPTTSGRSTGWPASSPPAARSTTETYAAAQRLLGDTGLVELVSLCGYYTLVSFLLNAFTVPLPPDAAPMWDGSPPPGQAP